MDISKVQDKNQISGTQTRGTADAKSAATAKVGDAKVAATGGKATSQAGAAEKVSWSAEASLAKEALEMAKTSPDVRSEKVAALKAAIKSGHYKVDADKVAERMVESSLEDDLITRRNS